MKRRLSLAIFILAQFIPCVLFAQQGDLAATVNGVAIKNSELRKAVDFNLEMLKAQGVRPLSEEENARIKNDTLNNLITRELLYQKAKSLISPEDISPSAVERAGAIKKKFSTEADFKDALFKRGVSEDEFARSVEMDVAIEKLFSRELSLDKVDALEDEMKAAYEANKTSFQFGESVDASHILIAASKDASQGEREKAMKEIGAIKKRLKAGEDFKELARECSKCPSSANGGKLGYIYRGQTVKPFEDAAFALKEGETGDVVKTEFGYHIIKAGKKVPAGARSFEEVKESLRQFILAQKRSAIINEYAKSLRKSADIKIY